MSERTSEWATDRPPRCLACGYALTGLPSPGQCPECSRGYDLSDPLTHSWKPPLVRWRLWGPGLLLTLVLFGALGGGLLALGAGWGWSLTVTLPLCAGTLLGYRTRAAPVVLILLVLGLVLSLVLGLVTMSGGGVFCGLMLAGFFLVPTFAGVAAGAIARALLKNSQWSQRWHLPVVFLGMLPVGVAVLEGRPGPWPAERVATTHVMATDPGLAWDAIRFYEQVEHAPPLLLRHALGYPTNARGSKLAVGDTTRCIFTSGHVTKRVTAVEPEERLAFVVIDQQLGYEHAVRLLSGAFEVEAIPGEPGEARVTLVTEYEPLLGPRWVWRPAERLALRMVQGHVLEGMAREVGPREGPERVADGR